ncbi:Spy/CpxP family protein refolding chaperone [Marinobacter sp. F4206]|nr:Spy/CpxP family protein refolding chaperone [Marinobacter sp. F4206]
MQSGGVSVVATLSTENFMKLAKLFGTALVAVSLSAPALAQQATGGQPDQVDQLAQMVGLSDDQQTEIRGIIDEMQGQIGELRQEARALQQQMQSEIKPDYDEDSIRENAEELGDLTGEIAALSTLMQAKVDSVFTEEQRATLDKRMQQMQQQMQQQRQMMQQQGQGQ